MAEGEGVSECITLRLERRDDGGLRVTCDEVPGLLLSHSRADLVMADVLPALAVLGWPTETGADN